MNSFRNLMDAGKILPAWTLPLLLSAGLTFALLFAQNHVADKPHELVSTGTLAAVVGSVFAAVLVLLHSIINAKPGELRMSMERGVVRGLNFVWATSSVALVVYVGAKPAWYALTENISFTLSGIVASGVMLGAYLLIKPKAQPNAAADPATGILATTALALPPGFVQSQEHAPTFQISMADLSRLMIHQAGRLIGYKGSNCCLNDGFSANLDVNARTAQIFSEMNLIATPQLIFWRMHMLLMGSAAEHVLRNSTSEASIDDLQSFDDLATRYLVLISERGGFSRPTNETEAAIKAARLGMIRKQIWSRCVSACASNKAVLLEMIKLLRGQACLSYGDIKHLLDRVVMPPDFPVAEFDTDAMMEKAFLAIEHQPSAEFEPVAEPPQSPSADTASVADLSDPVNVYHIRA